jgi:4-hydroxybenzoyl-CoA thioesterase
MASLVYRRRFSIEWAHCDPAGIVFNSRFFEFFDRGTWGLFEAALGAKPAEIAANHVIPLVDVDAQFLVPVRFGDIVDMTSQIREFRRSSFAVEHRLSTGDGELAVIGHEKRVWVVRDRANPSIIKSQPIPAEVIRRFEAR